MFSPFRAEDGSPKPLAQVAWDDLAQLKELDEGFALEFKRENNVSVRRKIPKIVASFANSRGGWLVIGIADDTKDVVPVPRPQTDFSQTLGEMCRRHVSPVPPFDVRFIADPADSGQGVIVVQVGEGDFPPYIADGLVEIREGSTSGPATGGELVELYDRANKRHAQVEDFCRRTLYYPQAENVPLPLFDLYLFRMGGRAVDAPTREDVSRNVAAMRAGFDRQGMECHVQHAHDSLILRTTPPFSPGEAHSAIELFRDGSMKLTVPAAPLADGQRKRAKLVFAQLGQQVPEWSRMVDARDTLRRVTRMAGLLDRFVRQRGLHWRSYAVAYELENMAGVMLYSDEEEYLSYVKGHGALFCGTTDGRSRIRYLDDGAHDSFRVRQFAGSHFFEACGLPLGSSDPADNALVDALLRTDR